MIRKTLVIEKLIVLCELQLHELFVFGKIYINEVSLHYSHPPSHVAPLILNFTDIAFHTCNA